MSACLIALERNCFSRVYCAVCSCISLYGRKKYLTKVVRPAFMMKVERDTVTLMYDSEAKGLESKVMKN